LWYFNFIAQYNVVLAMNCPYCGYSDCKVIDSREVNDGIRRRRQCLSCSSRFTTYERLRPGNLFVIKKDGRREEFDSSKLLTGIRKACEKRPLPTGTVDKLADDIEAELYRLGKAEVPSAAIGDMVMERLKSLDHIAYIRFASVYREFADITTLKQEVDTLLGAGVGISPLPGQLPLLPTEELAGVGKGRRASRGRGRAKARSQT
jgi:transcriptional repressor NrdR